MTTKLSESLFLTPNISCNQNDDGVLYINSLHTLDKVPVSLLDYLFHWAQYTPDKIFLAQRDPTDNSRWETINYAEMLNQASKIANALDTTLVSKQRPAMILSGNSIASAVITFACYLKGVAVVPVSPSYSLLSTDFGKVKHIQQQVNAAVVFAENIAPFAPVLETFQHGDVQVITADRTPINTDTWSFYQLIAQQPTAQRPRHKINIDSDTVAKILYTSGSTGMPKGVVNTHAMLTSNQEAIAKIWPFIERTDNILLDWLPWHHTFGGNHNFNLVLRNGCTLYIDNGKASAEGIKLTVNNLSDVSPTVYFNVAAGYDLLLDYLDNDAPLAKRFFKNLQVLMFAGAALAEPIWRRLNRLILQYADHPIPIVSSWGATETSPLCTSVYFANSITNNIGLPVPGVQLKLAPSGDLTELRVKGPNIMPHYHADPNKTAEVFDEEGYFCSGDAVELVNRHQPEKGLLFKGRVNENFKLFTGTWVNVSELRLSVIAGLAPLITDAVICGHNQRYLSLLLFLNTAHCQQLTGVNDANQLQTNTVLQQEIRHRLLRHNKRHLGSSMRIKKALIQLNAASLDANETTDKGYLNQRAILKNRSQEVDRLYADSVDEAVIQVN